MLINCSELGIQKNFHFSEGIHIYEKPSLFSINIDDILSFNIWRIIPCDFQIKLRNVIDVETEDLIFKNQILYKRISEKNLKVLKKVTNGGFLFKGYKRIINFLKQNESQIFHKGDFLRELASSKNLSNILQTFGEPNFHTGTSEGYDIFVYFGNHICQKYKNICNGVLIFVIGISGNIAAYCFIAQKCPCYFKDINSFKNKKNQIYIKCKKTEFI